MIPNTDKGESNHIPKIKIEGNELTISISLSDLIFIIENSEENYKVEKPDELLEHFKFELENFARSNATEKGISELQNLFDEITDEIYINGNDIITQKPIL